MARFDKPDPIIHVHAMKLQPADLFADERSEWEVIGRPFATAAGRTVHVRVRRVSDPALTELWTWAARERIPVQRVALETLDNHVQGITEEYPRNSVRPRYDRIDAINL